MEAQSETSTAFNSILMPRKQEEPKKALSRSRKGKSDRSPLLDITNDSPVYGLPIRSSEICSVAAAAATNCSPAQQTSQTGEAVKTLFKRVEEGEDFSKVSFEKRRFSHSPQVHQSSPDAGVCPTPANTPSSSKPLKDNTGIEEVNGGFLIVTPVSKEKDPNINQDLDGLQQETLKSHENSIHHAHLQFFSPAKDEVSDTSTMSSGLAFQESLYLETEDLDDDASSQGEEEMGEVDHEEVIREVEGCGKEILVEDEGGLFNELCAGLIEVEVIGEFKDEASSCFVPASAIWIDEEEIGEAEYEEVVKEVGDYGKEILVEDEGELINELCEGLIEVEVTGESEDYCEEVKQEAKDYEAKTSSEGGGLIDELCERLERLCLRRKGEIPVFRGRSTRLIYDSDDELEDEEEVREDLLLEGYACSGREESALS